MKYSEIETRLRENGCHSNTHIIVLYTTDIIIQKQMSFTSSSSFISTNPIENFNYTSVQPIQLETENENRNVSIISNEVIVVLLVITITTVVVFLLVYIVRVCKSSRTEISSSNRQTRPLPRLPAQYEAIRTDMRVEISQQRLIPDNTELYETPIPVHRRFISEVDLLPPPPPLPTEHLVQISGDNDGYEVPLTRCHTFPNLRMYGIKKKTEKRVRFADLESARNSLKSTSGESVPEITQGPVTVEKKETGIYVTSTTITISSRRRTQSSSQ